MRTARIASFILLLLTIWTLPSSASVLYVDGTRSDNSGNGLSWAAAKKNIYAAVNAASSGDEIWVKAVTGGYNEHILLMTDNVSLYGGFAGTETQRDQRNWTTNVTIIDGTGVNDCVLHYGTGVTNASVIDGFTIQHGIGHLWTSTREGGGILCDAGSPTIRHNRIINNTATGNGGGIRSVSGASPIIEYNTIQDNQADNGAGIFMYDGICRYNTITHNTRLTSNTSSFGGGIKVGNYAEDTTISDNTITDNESGAGGAGVQCTIADAVVSNNTITGNVVDMTNTNGSGGGVECYSGSPVIQNNTITYNQASGGGGVYFVIGTPTLSENDIQHNSAVSGGGVFLWNCPALVSDNTISNNTASNTSGAIYVGTGSSQVISGNTISGNEAASGSGAISLSSLDGATITGNLIDNNSAGNGNGGGIDFWNVTCAISNNTIKNNSAVRGGAIMSAASSPVVTNNLIVGNSASWSGGAIDWSSAKSGSQGSLINNTIAYNTCSNGGGIYTYSVSFEIINNIIAFNSSGIVKDSSASTITNNNVYNPSGSNYSWSPAPAGDISSDPSFIDQSNGDYHVPYGSPCVDAGTSQGAPDTDLDGHQRPFDGDGNGTAVVDIGAYEFRDEQAPTGSIIINDGADYTQSQDVILTLSATDTQTSVSQMQISNDGNYDTEPWETYAESKQWTLTSGDGTKQVSVRYKDSLGNITADQISDSIIFDTTPPDAGTASSPSTAQASPITVSYAGASDPGGSGLALVTLWCKKGSTGIWTNTGLTSTSGSGSFSYNPTTEATYYFDLVAEDNAGNVSTAASGDGDCRTIFETNLSTSGRAFVHNEYLYPGGPLIRTTTHDESGNQVRELTRSYGNEGELLSTSGSTDSVTYSYDAAYHITSIIDAANHVTNFIYDDDGDPNTQDLKQGYLCRVEYPGGEVVRYSNHDVHGRPLTRTDAKSVVTKYHYDDPAGLMTHIEYPATPALDVTYEYDPVYGRLISVTDGAGVTTYDYDDLDLPTSVTTTYTGLPAKTIELDYWPNGNLMTLTTPAGSFSYTYDGAGRPNGLTNPFSEMFSWDYYNNNWLQTQTTPASATSYAYNQRGFLTNITNRKTDQSLLSEYTGPTTNPKMAYNTVGDILSVTANIPNVATQYSGVTNYSYEANRSQLIQEQSTRNGGYNHEFIYDAAGNPTTFEGASKTYNAKNQNIAAGFIYDSNGNPTTYNDQALVFDAENRMTSFGTTLTAGYAGGGLRAWKESSSGRTYFLYSGNSPVCELDSAGNVIAVNTFGSTGLLARREGSLAQGTDKFYTFDPQGNVSQTLDTSGNVISTQLYDAYGTSLFGTAAFPYGFGGQYGYYTDQETGLQLLSHRYYDPEEGRFLTRDPIGYAGGQNLYSYVQNNPVNAIDASGFCRDKHWWDKLAEGRYYGTTQGETARDWYAEESVKHPWNPLYWVGGTLSSMWTPETYIETATVIATAGSLSGVGAAAQTEKAIAQVTINRANGLAFEDAALSARGIASNTEMVAGKTLSGSVRNTVIDSMDGGLTEVKNVAYQSYTQQLQAQISYAEATGQNYELIVNTSTKVSSPLQGAISDIGGTITQFDPATGVFIPY